MTEGKNYKLINEYGMQYKITNKVNGIFHYIINQFDIKVDTDTYVEDYFILIKDLDGEWFAQPMDNKILIEKLIYGWEGSTVDLFRDNL